MLESGASADAPPPYIVTRPGPSDDFDFDIEVDEGETPPPYQPPKNAHRRELFRSLADDGPGAVAEDVTPAEPAGDTGTSSSETAAELRRIYRARQTARSYYASMWLAWLFLVLCTILGGRSSVLAYPEPTPVWTQMQIALSVIIMFFDLLPVSGLLIAILRSHWGQPPYLFRNHFPFLVFLVLSITLSVIFPAILMALIIACLILGPMSILGPLEFAYAGVASIGILSCHAIWQISDNHLCRRLGIDRELFCGTCFGAWDRHDADLGDSVERIRAGRARARRLGFA